MTHARIGKVRLKVVGITPHTIVRSDRKADFAAHTAASFESYVRKYGCEPDSIVMVLGGLKQTAESYWKNDGDSKGGSTTMLAFAQATLQREISA